MQKKVVEVGAEVGDDLVPFGTMNTDQALALPADVEIRISHPDEKPGETDR